MKFRENNSVLMISQNILYYIFIKYFNLIKFKIKKISNFVGLCRALKDAFER